MRVELEEILSYFPKREQNSHKGSYGKILNIAGSKNYTGAAILSSLSALKTGAGYITLACPDVITETVASYSPDITFFPLKTYDNNYIHSCNVKSLIKKSKEYDVISIGSGICTNKCTEKFVIKFLENNTKPIVIDADAINIISEQEKVNLTANTIITPHPKELSRLLKTDVTVIQKNREEYAIMSSKKYGCVTVLKGYQTIVTDGARIYINETGNSGLAKAGSGDVLTGIITGIFAQIKDAFTAAALGVYLHGLSGDTGTKEKTEYGLLASEIIFYIPSAIKTIINKEKL